MREGDPQNGQEEWEFIEGKAAYGDMLFRFNDEQRRRPFVGLEMGAATQEVSFVNNLMNQAPNGGTLDRQLRWQAGQIRDRDRENYDYYANDRARMDAVRKKADQVAMRYGQAIAFRAGENHERRQMRLKSALIGGYNDAQLFAMPEGLPVDKISAQKDEEMRAHVAELGDEIFQKVQRWSGMSVLARLETAIGSDAVAKAVDRAVWTDEEGNRRTASHFRTQMDWDALGEAHVGTDKNFADQVLVRDVLEEAGTSVPAEMMEADEVRIVRGETKEFRYGMNEAALLNAIVGIAIFNYMQELTNALGEGEVADLQSMRDWMLPQYRDTLIAAFHELNPGQLEAYKWGDPSQKHHEFVIPRIERNQELPLQALTELNETRTRHAKGIYQDRARREQARLDKIAARQERLGKRRETLKAKREQVDESLMRAHQMLESIKQRLKKDIDEAEVAELRARFDRVEARLPILLDTRDAVSIVRTLQNLGLDDEDVGRWLGTGQGAETILKKGEPNHLVTAGRTAKERLLAEVEELLDEAESQPIDERLLIEPGLEIPVTRHTRALQLPTEVARRVGIDGPIQVTYMRVTFTRDVQLTPAPPLLELFWNQSVAPVLRTEFGTGDEDLEILKQFFVSGQVAKNVVLTKGEEFALPVELERVAETVKQESK